MTNQHTQLQENSWFHPLMAPVYLIVAAAAFFFYIWLGASLVPCFILTSPLIVLTLIVVSIHCPIRSAKREHRRER